MKPSYFVVAVVIEGKPIELPMVAAGIIEALTALLTAMDSSGAPLPDVVNCVKVTEQQFYVRFPTYDIQGE